LLAALMPLSPHYARLAASHATPPPYCRHYFADAAVAIALLTKAFIDIATFAGHCLLIYATRYARAPPLRAASA